MKIEIMKERFCVCKIADLSEVDFSGELVFVAKTDEELSLVCERGRVPQNVTALEDGWKAFRVEGVLDFGMVGVIAKIAEIFARERISIFVVSTYNTDYVLLKEPDFERGIRLLQKSGYEICNDEML